MRTQKHRRTERWCGASLEGDKNKIRGIYNRADYWANAYV